jgi:peroxiredoxin
MLRRRACRRAILLFAASAALAAGWRADHDARPAAADEATATASGKEDAPQAEGTLRVPYPEFGLLLMPVAQPGVDGEDPEPIEGHDGTLRVAAGRYHLLQWRVGTTDRAGRRWLARGNAWPEPIVVPPGGTVDLALAAPLRAHLQAVESNGVMHFHLEYAGTRGERCRGITVDGEPPPPPGVRILDAQGRVVGRTRFQKKCGGTCHAAWPISPGLKGLFRAVPEPQLGPMRLDVGTGITFDLNGARVIHTPPSVGRPAPDFALTTPKGQTVQLGFLRQRPVLLCFFCNCGLCHAFATEIARAKDLTAKLETIVVASDAAVAEDDTFRRETGLDALYCHDAPPITALRYNSTECPRCWLIDTKGVIRYVNPERLMPTRDFVAGLRAALSPPKSKPAAKPKPAAQRKPPTRIGKR